MYIQYDFFFKDTATTKIYTRSIVGSVRCVQETGYQRRVHGDDPVEFEEEWNFDIKVNLSSKPNSSSNTTTGVSSKYMRNSKLKNETGKESNNNNDFDYSW
eukprot:TRINITY_DN46178_c0_g1_i1.p2 TRINITY_DN46178_c0_g1~~TRINITY_DN46178_c0_g1_i1.p2  ORF type:complete len:101 (+),score=30.75 TRINITY_DN46178_c0_g1_i1:8-310(+)